MNRRAKRNKYRKLQRELERRIEFYKATAKTENCFSENIQMRIQPISCFRPIEAYSRLPVDAIKDRYTKEVAHQVAEEILKYPELYKITDTGYGYRYDFQLLKYEEK